MELLDFVPPRFRWVVQLGKMIRRNPASGGESIPPEMRELATILGEHLRTLPDPSFQPFTDLVECARQAPLTKEQAESMTMRAV